MIKLPRLTTMQIMRKVFIGFFIFLFALTFTTQTYAASAYVLPYPSAMPGGINYKIHLVWERVLQYWYFGDFGQFTYNLQESDKYLVEAKTLFEYNQYLLGYSALQKSNAYWAQTLPHLQKASAHGKDITDQRQLISSAAIKHIAVLQKMENETPIAFHWSPEKSAASDLQIHALIEKAISLAKQYE